MSTIRMNGPGLILTKFISWNSRSLSCKVRTSLMDRTAQSKNNLFRVIGHCENSFHLFLRLKCDAGRVGLHGGVNAIESQAFLGGSNVDKERHSHVCGRVPLYVPTRKYNLDGSSNNSDSLPSKTSPN
jgi:hypothetical protein